MGNSNYIYVPVLTNQLHSEQNLKFNMSRDHILYALEYISAFWSFDLCNFVAFLGISDFEKTKPSRGLCPWTHSTWGG